MEVNPGYKQTEIGVIPEDWGITKLPHVVWYQEGPGVRNYQFTSSGVKLLNGTNIENGKIHLDKTSRYISEQEAYGWYSHFLADAGDIVIACSGISVSRFDEKVGVLSSEHLPLCMNTSTMRFKVCSPLLDRDYFKHFLRSQVFKDQISGRATGSAQLNFGPAHVTAASIPLPSNTEQEAIAESLSDADAYIESLGQIIVKKRQIKQGAMQELLTGKRRLPGFGEEWVLKTLREVAHIKTGSCNSEDKVLDGEYPFFVRSEHVETINTYSHNCEAILVPGEGRIGEIFHYINGRFDVHQRVYAITQFRSDMSARFVHFYMSLNFGSWAMQNTVKATVDSLRLPTFQAFEMRVPPTSDEQTAIATILSDMDAEITALEDKLAKARRIKQGMMQELLTGRIRLI